MRNQFVFSVAEYPNYFHYAHVNQQAVEIIWDTNYLADVTTQFGDGWYEAVDKAQVEKWILNGDWIVYGDTKPKSNLKGQLVQLQLGFEALEEGFQSLRNEFERLKQEG